jgi:hypothetical protein
MKAIHYQAVVGVSILCANAGNAYAQVVLDQQQLIYDGGLSARTLPSYTVWQSFTAGLTGPLVEIDMGFFNDMSGNGTLRIYAGEGTTGAVLQTLNVPVVGITQPPVTWDNWTVNVPVVAGQIYTFELTPNPQTLPDPYGVAIGASNPYPRGVLGLNDPSGSQTTSFDTVFRTFVAVPEPTSLLFVSAGMLASALTVAIRRRRVRLAQVHLGRIA